MVEIVSKYTAKVQKADGWWVIEVPEIGYCTQARNYSELNTCLLYTSDAADE